MLTLLLGATLALADDPELTPVEPAWVLVDRRTPLRLQPADDGERLVVETPAEAPPHRAPPVLVLLRVGQAGDWLRVRLAHHAPALDAELRPLAPDVVPPTWTHCYPQAAALAQLDAGFWVRAADVLPVLAAPYQVRGPDGAVRAELSPGLAVTGGALARKVIGQHLSVVAPIPDDLVSDSYPLGLGPPPSAMYAGVDGTGSFALSPAFRPYVDLGGAAPRVEGTTAGGRTVTGLRDRCIDVRLPPTPGVLPRDVAAKAPRRSWPVLVPEGTTLAPRGEAPLAKVAESTAVVWSTKDCAWTEAEGLCCAALGGLRLEGTDAPLCYDVDLPTARHDDDLARVLESRTTELVTRTAAAAAVRGEVTWRFAQVRGAVDAAAVDVAMKVEREKLHICYDRELAEDPWMHGDLTLRFAIAGDGVARYPTSASGEIVDPRLRECVARRLANLVVPDQIGAPATIVDVVLSFRTVPVDAQ